MYIHWRDEFNLHNDLIDTQHRMVMLLCRKLDICVKTGAPRTVTMRVVQELRKFIEFHFVSEQNLMHEIGYPQVHEHTDIHNRLLIDLQQMQIRLYHLREFPEDILYEINAWVVQHIATDDAAIAAYVKASSERPIGEGLYREYLQLSADSRPAS